MRTIANRIRRAIAASSWCSFCDTTTDRDWTGQCRRCGSR